MTCVHLKTEPRVCLIGQYDGKPSEDDCKRCLYYEGPIRGAGDRMARAIKNLGFGDISEPTTNKVKTKNSRGCSGCAKRRALLNKRFPKGQD